MSDNKENEVIRPAEGKTFYAVVIEILTEDSETGKVKKVKEEHLVDGVNIAEVEAKVAKEMEFTMGEWKIVKCQTSKIIEIY